MPREKGSFFLLKEGGKLMKSGENHPILTEELDFLNVILFGVLSVSLGEQMTFFE